ncbi:MAG: hypothetical protein ACK4NR_09330 [Micavibrio sp.]
MSLQQTSNIIPFPHPSRAARFDAPPAREPLRSDGMPVRVGDTVLINSARNGQPDREGWITEVSQPGGLTGLRTYSVFCTDGVHRIARADFITAIN